MKPIRHLLVLAFTFLCALTATAADTLMPLPPHNSVFTGNVRGYWFVAPSNFVIKGLRVPTDASSGNQSIAVLRLAAPPPIYASTTNDFETLFLTQNNPETGVLPVNITVQTGDIIGILGQRATSNSYGTAGFVTQIDGQDVTLARFGMQFPLTTTAPQQVWTENGGSISRVEMYYGKAELSNTPLFTRGDVLPTAGVDPNIPAEAAWYSFGVPAIDQDSQVGFFAKWKNPKGSASTYGSGLFVDHHLRAYVGQAVPGIPDATFTKFRDPVISHGYLATIATIAGLDVDKTNDTAVILVSPAAEVTVLAREGSPGVDVDGATIKAFKSVSVQGGNTPENVGVVYTASLNIGTGTTPVTAATDYAGWLFYNTVSTVLVREGGPTSEVGVTVKTFTLLKSISGSPQQSREHILPDRALFSAKLSDGTQGLLLNTGGIPPSVVLRSGATVAAGPDPDTVWKTFGPVSTGDEFYAMKATLVNNVGGVTSPGTTKFFLSFTDPGAGQWLPFLSVGDAGEPGGPVFKSFKDPVIDATGNQDVAFYATLDAPSTSDASLWWFRGGFGLMKLAREADPAPGGGTWKKFSSLAVPSGATGPLVLGSLVQDGATITADNDVGVWGASSDLVFQKFFREGDDIAGRTLKSFVALKNVSGSPGTGHAYNSTGKIVWRAAYVGGLSGIVLTVVP